MTQVIDAYLHISGNETSISILDLPRLVEVAATRV